ncbi:MAG: hypothetical protein IPH07_11220 [Deltaproteobacteria bacterium]|nr:hypothetical protein [Deltaproteobacteria bacterium]MBK8237315.1 hypothetical protein [Deltaproteobacteria bacterium]MBK8719005.1 hypothetical protein [Deltaproteobacteria bacterium]MBP7285439.1 hypothetical protein [Nannocystaceae bacterium]
MHLNDRTAVALAACFVVSIGCGREGGPAGQQGENSGRSGCALAEVGGVQLNSEHATAIQAAIQPTPTMAAAERLLVDAALAHLSMGGSLTDSSAQEWLGTYRRFQAAAAQDANERRSIDVVLERLAKAKSTYGFRDGRCLLEEDGT